MKRQYKKNSKSKRYLLLFVLAAVFLAGLWANRNPDINLPIAANQAATDSQPAEEFDKSEYSLNDPTSIWAVVNKGRDLGDYVPADLVYPKVRLRDSESLQMQLRKEPAQALENMFSAAKNEGVELMIASAYRSYMYQNNLYNRYLTTQGQAVTDATSARPGHSEHQTGLAVDVGAHSRKCEIEKCFAETPEGHWVAGNAHKYGYIIRYPEGKQTITGYDYEPWHLRYVGTELSAQLHQTGQTLEEFFNLPQHDDYPDDIYRLKPGA